MTGQRPDKKESVANDAGLEVVDVGVKVLFVLRVRRYEDLWVNIWRVPGPLIRYGVTDDGCAGVEECKDEIASITARRLDEQSRCGANPGVSFSRECLCTVQ
jgi:hypothetical protein